jgi:4-amino-4-deoxy-L-arabinose transferase-like glycosyltransferase
VPACSLPTSPDGLRHRVRALRASWWTGVAALALLAAAIRVPFLFAGLSMDEGGYAYVARQWSDGARLYSNAAWVDRPQGLLLLYRGLLLVSDSAWGIRLGVVVAGTAIAVALAVIGRELASPGTGLVAAGTYAIAGIAPAAEGFTFNGELAASVFTAIAVACALAAVRPGGHARLGFVLAGLAAGYAVLVKQSAFDGLAVAVVVLVAHRRAIRVRAAAGSLVAAFSAVVAAALLHGVSVGFSRYWWSIYGYRANAPSGAAAPLPERLELLRRTIGTVAWDVLPLAVIALLGVIVAWRTVRPTTSLVAGSWILCSFAGLNVGGMYWPHYFVQLLPSLCVAAALAIRVAPRRIGALVAAALCAPVLATAAAWATEPEVVRARQIPYLRRSDVDVEVARQVERCPGRSLLVVPSEADLYFLADRRAAMPYLWGRGVTEIPSAESELTRLLDSPNPPAIVADYSNGWSGVDPTGADRRRLRAYVPVARYPGVRLLARSPAVAAACRADAADARDSRTRLGRPRRR